MLWHDQKSLARGKTVQVKESLGLLSFEIFFTVMQILAFPSKKCLQQFGGAISKQELIVEMVLIS